MKNNCPTLTCELQPALHDAAALAPGQRWGAYWKHPDGWMKLFPPAAETIRDEAHTVQHAAYLHDLDNDPEDEKFLVLFILFTLVGFGCILTFLAV